MDFLRIDLPSLNSIELIVRMAPQIPKTCKAAIFKEKGGPLVIEEVNTPQPQEGEILIKVLACGVCHSEAMVQDAMMGPLCVAMLYMNGGAEADRLQAEDSRA